MHQNNRQVPGDGTADPSLVIKNGDAPGFMYAVDDNRVPGAPAMLSTAQHPIESDMSAGVSYKAMENPVGSINKASSAAFPSQPTYASVERGAGAAQPLQRLISDIDNMAAQSQSQWLRPSGPADYSVSSDMLNEQEELTIDEGTISISTSYSQKYVIVHLGSLFAQCFLYFKFCMCTLLEFIS